jgi:DNA-binding HxlR family transcriptional regulator
MRSYGQYCALAKALDVVGDRWTLLIARELLIREACRYTDLRNGLPGIATNLLADRLSEMEEAGLVYRESAPPPIATTLFHLTSRGKELEAVVDALGRWGAPLLAKSTKKDVFCSHWIALPLNLHVRDQAPGQPQVTVEVRAGNEPVIIETLGDGKVRARPGAAPDPDGVLDGPPELIIGLLTGKLRLKEARASGLRYEGDPKVLRRLQPAGAAREL